MGKVVLAIVTKVKLKIKKVNFATTQDGESFELVRHLLVGRWLLLIVVVVMHLNVC